MRKWWHRLETSSSGVATVEVVVPHLVMLLGLSHRTLTFRSTQVLTGDVFFFWSNLCCTGWERCASSWMREWHSSWLYCGGFRMLHSGRSHRVRPSVRKRRAGNGVKKDPMGLCRLLLRIGCVCKVYGGERAWEIAAALPSPGQQAGRWRRGNNNKRSISTMRGLGNSLLCLM